MSAPRRHFLSLLAFAGGARGRVATGGRCLPVAVISSPPLARNIRSAKRRLLDNSASWRRYLAGVSKIVFFEICPAEFLGDARRNFIADMRRAMSGRFIIVAAVITEAGLPSCSTTQGGKHRNVPGKWAQFRRPVELS